MVEYKISGFIATKALETGKGVKVLMGNFQFYDDIKKSNPFGGNYISNSSTLFIPSMDICMQ